MKKTLALIVILHFIISLNYIAAQQPSNTNTREVSFNDGWLFNLPTQTTPQNVHLPHHYNDDAYLTPKYYRGEATYSKHIKVDTTKAQKRHTLYFEGVNSHAKVFLNDSLLKEHKGGYTAFYVELSDYLRYGNYNEIKVVVDNTNDNFAPQSGDFTIFGGIYRPVWWIEHSEVSFTLSDTLHRGFQFITNEISNLSATSTAKLSITNKTTANQKITVTAHCLDNENNEIFTISDKYKLKVGDNSLSVTLPEITNPKLWSPSTPNLYKLTITLTDKNGNTLDHLTENIGLKYLAIDDQNRLLLNGEPLKLVGASRHQDRATEGIALSDAQHFEDIKALKDMGANFIRLAHYPQSRAVLDACDRLGLLVWEEIPIVDIICDNDEFRANGKLQLREMISQHSNHPSVAFWGYMNEVIIQIPYRIKDSQEREELYTATVQYAQELDDLCKALDPSRLTVMAYHGSELYNEIGLSSVADISGWNLYNGWYSENLTDFETFISDYHSRYPDRPIIISEFGAGSDKRIHSLHPEKFDFSIEYQREFMEHYWPVILDSTYIMGGAMWNFVDFSSAARQESMPRINNKGLLHTDRTPKDIYFYHQALLGTNTPLTYIASRDWNNREILDSDSLQSIKIYSNAPSVELLINGVSHGSKPIENCTATWLLPLPQGTLNLEARAANSSDSYTINIKHIKRHTATTNNVDININAGSKAYFYATSSHEVFTPDTPYQQGSWGYIGGQEMRRGDRGGTTAEIQNTDNDPIFQTQREGEMTYRFDIPRGKYKVTLHLADLNFYGSSLVYDLAAKVENSRETSTFNISLNGKPLESNFSPADEVGGNTALTRSYIVTITEPYIELSFTAIEGKPFVNAISIKNI